MGIEVLHSVTVEGDFGAMEVITNGYKGGDGGHGGFTKIILRGLEEPKLDVDKSAYHAHSTTFTAKGDWELSQIIHAFEDIAKALTKEFNPDGGRMW